MMGVERRDTLLKYLLPNIDSDKLYSKLEWLKMQFISLALSRIFFIIGLCSHMSIKKPCLGDAGPLTGE